MWEEEKKRIEKLRWWDEVAGKHGFPTDIKVWHVHPLAWVENFGNTCSSDICNVPYYELKVSIGTFRVSHETMNYILEVEKYEKRPYVPNNSATSGVTIAYGYDLGHQNETTARNELAGLYTPEEINRLIAVLGLKGDSARAELNSLQNIEISKENAGLLALRMKRRYAQQVVDVYPQVIKFHPHCQGALLSLVINRGNGLRDPNTSAIPEPRREMRGIREDFRNDTPNNIPNRLLDMKRIWVNANQGGLLIRRDKEAKFFERGLECICFKEK
jgi:hypothetical protein